MIGAIGALPEEPAIAKLLFQVIAWLESRTGFTAQPHETCYGVWYLVDASGRKRIQLTPWTNCIDADGVNVFGPSAKLWPITLWTEPAWTVCVRRLENLCLDLDL